MFRYLVLLALAAVLVACGSSASPANQPQPSPSPIAADPRIAPPGSRTQFVTPGQRIERDGVAYTFRRRDPAADQAMVVEVVVENIASANNVYNSPGFLMLTDSMGYTYRPEERPAASHLTDISVGKTRVLTATFQTAAGAKGLMLYFTPVLPENEALFAIPLDAEPTAQITPLDGPTVEDSGYRLTVVSVRRGDVREYLSGVSQDRLIIEVAFDNQSKTPINLHPAHFTLQGAAEAYRSELTGESQALSQFLLLPGMRARGLLVFDAPSAPDGYTLAYRPRMMPGFSLEVPIQE